jgi:hypothetical protein
MYQAYRSNANPTGLRKLQETCGLLIGYLECAVYRGMSNRSRFPTLRNESYDRLVAVCIEFGSADTGRKAVKLLCSSASSVKPTLTVKALGRLLHHIPMDDNLEKASKLVLDMKGCSMEQKMELCDEIIMVCKGNLYGNR